jgi:hypothetical protein
LVARAQRDHAKLVQPHDQALDLFSEPIAKVPGVGSIAGIRERQHRNRTTRRLPKVLRCVVQQATTECRHHNDDRKKRQQRKALCSTTGICMSHDTAGRQLVGPRQDTGDRKAYDHHGNQDRHRVFGNRQPIEGHVRHLQQHPGNHRIGDERTNYAAVLEFLEQVADAVLHRWWSPPFVTRFRRWLVDCTAWRTYSTGR